MSDAPGTNAEREAIERRWSTHHDRGAYDYTDGGCRILAEHAFRDVAALLAALEAAHDALRGVGWNETDGLCWCSESRELTREPEHQPKCIAARAALDRSDANPCPHARSDA